MLAGAEPVAYQESFETYGKDFTPENDFWRGQHGDLLRSSAAFYASEVLRGPPQPPYNGHFIINDHHEEWDDLVHSHDRICVLAPRDHGKTFFFDFAVPLHKASFQPNGRGYIFSATQDQAIRILQDIKDEIEDNPKLAWLMPNPKEQWNATSIKLANGHRIYARSFGTKIRGAHPNWIVVDDGLNDEDAYSELVRTKHIDYFLTAITNMIVPGGQIIVVGTPFHGSDLYAYLEINVEYRFRRYQAIDEKTDKVLWPDRYSRAILERKKREIGSVRFTREFLCQPVSDDMSLFPERLFRGDPTEQYTVKLGAPAKFWDGIGVTRRFIGVDLAISTTTAADFFVIFVIGLDAMGNRWVVDIIRPADPVTQRPLPLGYQQMLSLINAAGRKYGADMIYLEANQMQRVFGDELIRTTDLPIKKFVTTGVGQGVKNVKNNTTSQNKNSLEGGVPSLRVLLENGKFRIPRGDAHSVEVTDQWIGEMRSFTWLDGKLQGVGAHDDTVMALWIADQAVRTGGFSFSTGEDANEEQSYEDFMAEQIGEEDDDTVEGEQKRRDERDKLPDPVEAVMATIRKNGKSGKAPPTKHIKFITGDEDDEPTFKPPASPDAEAPKSSGNLIDDEDDGTASVVKSAWSRLPGLRRG